MRRRSLARTRKKALSWYYRNKNLKIPAYFRNGTKPWKSIQKMSYFEYGPTEITSMNMGTSRFCCRADWFPVTTVWQRAGQCHEGAPSSWDQSFFSICPQAFFHLQKIFTIDRETKQFECKSKIYEYILCLAIRFFPIPNMRSSCGRF